MGIVSLNGPFIYWKKMLWINPSFAGSSNQKFWDTVCISSHPEIAAAACGSVALQCICERVSQWSEKCRNPANVLYKVHGFARLMDMAYAGLRSLGVFKLRCSSDSSSCVVVVVVIYMLKAWFPSEGEEKGLYL